MIKSILFDETEIHIEGSGTENILMLHGWPDTYQLWDAQVDILKDNYRCIRFTLPSFDTSGPRQTHTIDEISELMKNIIEVHIA
jgi:pimeloyl-ACP methyl ester carboxylesterase